MEQEVRLLITFLMTATTLTTKIAVELFTSGAILGATLYTASRTTKIKHLKVPKIPKNTQNNKN